MEIGDIVRQSVDGSVGVVVPNTSEDHTEGKTAVVPVDTDDVVLIDTEALQYIKKYDPTVATQERCGMGHGEKTCKYLGLNAVNLCCLRFSARRVEINTKQMTAKGSPKQHFPGCQDEIKESIKGTT